MNTAHPITRSWFDPAWHWEYMSESPNQKSHTTLWKWSRSLPLGIQFSALTLLAVLVPLSVYVTVALPVTVRRLVDSNSKQLELQTGQAVRELDRFFSRRIERFPGQAEFLDSEDKQAIIRHLNDIYESDRELPVILLVDLAGHPISIAGETSPEGVNSFLLDAGVQQLMESCRVSKVGEVFISDAVNAESGPAVFLATPIADRETKEIVRIFLIGVSLSRPIEIVNELARRLPYETKVHLGLRV